MRRDLFLCPLLGGCVVSAPATVDTTEPAQLAALQRQLTQHEEALGALESRLQALEAEAATAKTLDGYATESWVQDQGYGGAAELSLLSALSSYLTVNSSLDTLFISGANLHIRSGSGATNDDGSLTGLGNLVVGYNLDGGDERVGSHNLVVGDLHSYSSFGGIVSGEDNAISGSGAVVLGATASSASGLRAAVFGGTAHAAPGEVAVIVGSGQNTNTGKHCTISGGTQHSGGGDHANITGGQQNTTTSGATHVSGGQHNTAADTYASVVGGSHGQATRVNSSVLGGSQNLASDESAVVLGGQYNTAGAPAAVVVGGQQNAAYGNVSVVFAGQFNTTRAVLGYAPAD